MISIIRWLSSVRLADNNTDQKIFQRFVSIFSPQTTARVDFQPIFWRFCPTWRVFIWLKSAPLNQLQETVWELSWSLDQFWQVLQKKVLTELQKIVANY